MDVERIQAIKQGVLADVSCVLARANGADIDPKMAFSAARNLCDILFGRCDRRVTGIPKLFWETPLGRAVGVCHGDTDERETHIRTTVRLPQALHDQLQRAADESGRPLTEVLAEAVASGLQQRSH